MTLHTDDQVDIDVLVVLKFWLEHTVLVKMVHMGKACTCYSDLVSVDQVDKENREHCFPKCPSFGNPNEKHVQRGLFVCLPFLLNH